MGKVSGNLLGVRREEDRVYGPGIYDMKGGAYIAYYAYRHLVRMGELSAHRLLSLHNLHYTLQLVDRARAAIEAGSFAAFQEAVSAERSNESP